MYGQKKATKEILDDFKKYFNPYSSFQKASWQNLCQQYSLSEDFIREYKDFIDWDVVIATQDDMSIDFIREFKDKIDWDELSYFGCSAFNENIFEEFNNDVNWNFILTKQKDKITKKIIERFENNRICKEIK